MHKEKTLVLIKPDGVQRSLIGKITSRFEDAGLKIVAMKMLHADKELAQKHYPLNEEWAKNVFEKTLKSYQKDNKKMKYKDHIELGTTVQSWLIEFITESPIIAMVLEGPHAIELVRKMTGSTEPRQAAPGTIRGDFISIESYALADKNDRTIRNLIHASDSSENADKEISLWFSQNEIHDYSKELDKHF